MVLKCRGFLFDLDGTLIDSLPAVERAWIQFADKMGINRDEVLNYVHGTPAILSLRHFMPDASEEEITNTFKWIEKIETEDTEGITALPGAIALIDKLNALDIPWAIVTSGTVPLASARHKVAELPEPAHWVTAESVTNGKPNPEPYLLGAKKLGLLPEECVVFEDAAAGINAGLDAGCQVVVVHDSPDIPRRDEIHLTINNLEDIEIVKSGSYVSIYTQ
ncbi:sugar phosphatase [Xenorhabdus thuongxuanensis]|uniref:Sugar phosphatase n=1 Tax=Xenorhabdus thuongxuanensis TaxID=1873484 RepID=A0A1Q5U8B4_9GAMM|nr:sugar phosphatase [Xenorhabdus thuongxuanensis]OKP08718.1 sugar phosphatase [Xenorhabdus thuongxuanensis]